MCTYTERTFSIRTRVVSIVHKITAGKLLFPSTCCSKSSGLFNVDQYYKCIELLVLHLYL